MKKLFNTLVSLLLFATMLAFTGCLAKKEPMVIKESDTYIVIHVSSEQMELTDTTTLVEYMNALKEDGALDFEMTNGMVSSVNGIENPADWSSCWMLYTSDEDNANTAWGEVEYKGEVYGSAIVGAETLTIKEGCLYIWIYQSF
jgi:hypothetical protein